jgi:hypothetical protein
VVGHPTKIKNRKLGEKCLDDLNRENSLNNKGWGLEIVCGQKKTMNGMRSFKCCMEGTIEVYSLIL